LSLVQTWQQVEWHQLTNRKFDMPYTNNTPIGTKNIKYLNKSFSDFKSNLIQFAQTYYPETYNDFNEASPGMMFLEMSAYVGDVLGYYLDYQFKESLIQHAEEPGNIYRAAEALGYTPTVAAASSVTLDLFHLLPATGSGDEVGPDWRYSLIIEDGMRAVSTDNGTQFTLTQPVDFRSSASNATEVSVYSVDANGAPDFYILRKQAKASSGELKTFDFPVGAAQRSLRILMPAEPIIEVTKCTDSDGNEWKYVPYLAQDLTFEETRVTNAVDPGLSDQSVNTPYLLTLKKSTKRFTYRITRTGRLELQFGSGTGEPDETLIPNPENVGSGIPGSVSKLDKSFDPSNFIYTRTYGESPVETTLTVEYLVGNGVNANVASNTITGIENLTATNNEEGISTDLLDTVKQSVACTNPEPAAGGKSAETVDEVRFAALSNYAAQNRAVTREDYITRVYSMPNRFGSIAKAYIVQDSQITPQGNSIPNPLALNLYVLGYDKDNKLTQCNSSTKENLRNYLSQYRMLTDAINIKDGYIVNIAVDFQIIALPTYNGRQVVLQCIDRLKDYFEIQKMQFNQPIIIKELITTLAQTEGVQSVLGDPIVTNKYSISDGYSGNRYVIESAIRNGVIYPSQDPCVFEVKFPDIDIRGQASSY